MKALSKFLTFSLIILFSSCGKSFLSDLVFETDRKNRVYETSNPIFNSYISEFEKNARSTGLSSQFKVNDIPINLGEIAEGYDGVCYQYSSGKKEVIIKTSFWSKASETQKKILVFHELGHCSLNRDHESLFIVSDNGNKIKNSIMHHIIPDNGSYNEFTDSYLKELYTNNDNYLLTAFIQKTNTQAHLESN